MKGRKPRAQNKDFSCPVVVLVVSVQVGRRAVDQTPSFAQTKASGGGKTPPRVNAEGEKFLHPQAPGAAGSDR